MLNPAEPNSQPMIQSRAKSILAAIAFCWILAHCMSWPAFAHQQPVSLIILDIAPEQVAMQIHLPLNELDLAFGHRLLDNPAQLLGPSRQAFTTYLLQHIRPKTAANGIQPISWQVRILDLKLAAAEQAQGGRYQEAVVDLLLIPPPGASTRRFSLHYDVIAHQVVTHKAMLSFRRDWAAGRASGAPVGLGLIQVNPETSRVDALDVHLGEGTWLAGVRGMVALGMEHIGAGADHLLFLLVLLLPATLSCLAGRWRAFSGTRKSLLRLLGLVSAFTLGHSLSLLLAALGYFQAGPQAVEVCVALSVLVSAIHAIRPLFSGKEIYVTASFGLVHGLAFASGLGEMHLGLGTLLLSIFAFNVGIELMQLFVIVLTLPWLILLSLSRFHALIRVTLASLSALAALAWAANRMSGHLDTVTQALDSIVTRAPLGVLLLAVVAMTAYLCDLTISRKFLLEKEESV